MHKNGEDDFQIRPTRGRAGTAIPTRYAPGYHQLGRMVRQAKRRRHRGIEASTAPQKFYVQRCVVKIRFAANRKAGQWAAHGRYMGRKKATRDIPPVRSEPAAWSVAHSGHSEEHRLSRVLAEWQCQGDPRLFKLVVSPEFGDRIDLPRMARKLMERVEAELSSGKLEWVAVAHYNTDNPHLHIALRGVTDQGTLRLPRELIQSGVRRIAQDLCTRELGYRTRGDQLEAARRRQRSTPLPHRERE